MGVEVHLGKVRTAARETAPLMAVRGCSGRGGEARVCGLGEGGAHTIKHVLLCRRLLLVTRSRHDHERF